MSLSVCLLVSLSLFLSLSLILHLSLSFWPLLICFLVLDHLCTQHKPLCFISTTANKEVESNEPSEDITNSIYATIIDIYETLPFSGVDEIYQEPDTGPEPGECEVYESIHDKYRDHADVEQNDKRPALQEHAQEDAKGVDVHPVTQQMPVKDQLPGYPRDVQSEEKVLNSKAEQSYDQCHVYHTLEELKFDG